MKTSAPRIDSRVAAVVSPFAKVLSLTSPSSMLSWSAIFWARTGCERPEKSISFPEGPRSIQRPRSPCGWGVCSGVTSRPGSDELSRSAFHAGSPPWSPVAPARWRAIRRDVLGDVRAAADPCIVSDRHRSLEAIVNAGPDVPADRRPLLLASGLVRVVGRDRAGADVRALADLGIAEVARGAAPSRPRRSARS